MKFYKFKDSNFFPITAHNLTAVIYFLYKLFLQPDDCEQAYFKMDNVLIDDRRIHVDFSQSVAKVKWKGKGKFYV